MLILLDRHYNTYFCTRFLVHNILYRDNLYNIALSSKNRTSNFLEKTVQNLFTLQNQFITPRVFAPISSLQRNKPGTNRRCINARRKSATAKFKALGGYLCIDKSTPAEWRTEFGGEMVLARFLWEAVCGKKASRKNAVNWERRRKASRNCKVVGGKSFRKRLKFH